MLSRCARGIFNAFALRARGFVVRLLRACLKMGRGSVWEGRVRLARREEEADPQRSVTDKQRRQRALLSQTLRAADLSGLDCVGSGGTDRRRSAPPLTALPNPRIPQPQNPSPFSDRLSARAYRWRCRVGGQRCLGVESLSRQRAKGIAQGNRGRHRRWNHRAPGRGPTACSDQPG